MLTLADCLASGVRLPRLSALRLDDNPASEDAKRHAVSCAHAAADHAHPLSPRKPSEGEAAAAQRVARAARVGQAVRDALEGGPARPRRSADDRTHRREGPVVVDALSRQWAV